MKLVIISLTILAGCCALNEDEQESFPASEYAKKRALLMENEAMLALGGDTILTAKEEKLNECLMRHKFKEIDYAFQHPEYFNQSYHYFLYKDNIKNSPVYRIIRDLPKGAALHIHDMGLLGPDYIMKLTYMDNLYMCDIGHSVKFMFANNSSREGCDNWQLVSDLRHNSTDVNEFDRKLRKHFTMVVDNPADVYPNIHVTWDVFLNYFGTVTGLVTYLPVWEQYFYDALKVFREENIMYIEIRSLLPNLYELDGTTYDLTITAKSYKKAIARFKKDYPDFVGAKVIYAPSRVVDRNQIKVYLEEAKRVKSKLGSNFAGFDLVGYENGGDGPLVEFAPQLMEASKELNYFFHAGETDWYGTLADNNLVDAILLGSKRLGHAYALSKHPELIKIVMQKEIGLEVNVISNNVLSLVSDIRNHPLATFIANGLPVVISSDDPGIWESDVISHDFYAAFVGVASCLADLRLLKTFAINSLKYSAMEFEEKMEVLKLFDTRWDSFVDKFNCSDY